MKLRKTEPQQEYPNYLLSFRIDIDDEQSESFEQSQKMCIGYLEWRGLKTVRSSAGIHRESEKGQLHYHYHLEVATQPVFRYYKCESNQFKKYINKIWLKDNSTNHIVGHGLHFDKPKTSTLLPVEEAIISYLQYPLKEKLPIESLCVNIDTQTLMNNAYAEYQLVKKRKKEESIKKDEDKLRWNVIVKHLEETNKKTFITIFSELIEFTRKDNPPVSLKVLEQKTINYMKHKSLLSNHQLIEISIYGTKSLYTEETKYTNTKNQILTDCPELEEYKNYF